MRLPSYLSYMTCQVSCLFYSFHFLFFFSLCKITKKPCLFMNIVHHLYEYYFTTALNTNQMCWIFQWSSCKIQVWSSKLWCLLIRVNYFYDIICIHELWVATVHYCFFCWCLTCCSTAQTRYYDTLSLSNDVTLFQFSI